MVPTLRYFEKLRDKVCLAGDEPSIRELISKKLFLAFLFVFCFELGWRSSNFILFQFLVGSFSFYFSQRVLQKLLAPNFATHIERVPQEIAAQDRTILTIIQTHFILLARENVLPLQSGGVMILGYVVEPDFGFDPKKLISLLPGVALGAVYCLALWLEQKFNHREKWLKAAVILEKILDSRGN